MERVALVVGEALVDVVHRVDGTQDEYAGGSAANAAVALSRLDKPVRLATAFTDDHYGRVLAEHLAAAGVRLAGDPQAIGHTSSATATLDDAGGASYVFDLEWRLNPVDLDGVEPVVVHTSSLGAVLAPGADAVADLLGRLRSSAIISYDVNARPSITGTGPDVVAAVHRIAALADIVKASDEDLEALYPGRTLDEAARHLLARGPTVVVVTRGGDGASWVSGTGSGQVAAVPVTVADTIGAGDTFGAGLLDALWERDLLGAAQRSTLRDLTAETWDELLTFAASAAAITVSRPGADPPYRHELG
jgi:fructokinase